MFFECSTVDKLAICQKLQEQGNTLITALVVPDEEALVYGIANGPPEPSPFGTRGWHCVHRSLWLPAGTPSPQSGSLYLPGKPASALTALDVTHTMHFEGIPLVGIDIRTSSGVGKALVGPAFPFFKIRVHPLLPTFQLGQHSCVFGTLDWKWRNRGLPYQAL